jgi:hypothetical protein
VPVASPSAAEELPEPDVSTVLWRVTVQSLIATMPPKQAKRFLRSIAETFASEDALSAIMPIRPGSSQAAVQRARRGALAMYRAQLPLFISMLGRTGAREG